MQVTKFNLVTDLQIMLSKVTHSNFYFECNTERGSIDQLYIELGLNVSKLLPFKSLTSFFRQSKKTIDDCMILGHKIIHCYSCKCYKGRYSYAKFSHLGICDLTNFTKVHNKAIDYYICHCPYSCMINESNINKDLKYNHKPGRGRNYYKAETQSNISIPA